MNQRDSEAAAVKMLEAWRNERVDPSLLGVQDQRQLQNVAKTLRGVGRTRVRRQRWRRSAGAVAVAATVTGLGLGGWLMSREPDQPLTQAAAAAAPVVLAETHGEVRIQDAEGLQLAPATPLELGASLETQTGTATLTFASGARADVASASQIVVQAAGGERREALSLARGAVDVEVPRLAQPVEFSVQTPDARVVVHGTRFTVQVDEQARAGAMTHVSVSRGLVAVLSGGAQSWVKAGEEWPARAESPDADGPRVEPEAPQLSPARHDRAERAARPRTRHGAARHRHLDRGSLAAENRLFAAAMAKHKAGDFSAALQGIDRLITRYPDTLLMQEARVERFRLLRRLGRHAEAAREARSYLGDYHDGYARDEARSLALENP